MIAALLLTLLLTSPLAPDSIVQDTTAAEIAIENIAATDTISDDEIAEEIFEEEIAEAQQQSIEERADSVLIALAEEKERPYSTTVFDDELVAWALAWLDTTDCDLLPDTTPLPDSVYIRRLQAMPREMEMT